MKVKYYLHFDLEGLILEGCHEFGDTIKEDYDEAVEQLVFFGTNHNGDDCWQVRQDYSHTIKIVDGEPVKLYLSNDADNLCIDKVASEIEISRRTI